MPPMMNAAQKLYSRLQVVHFFFLCSSFCDPFSCVLSAAGCTFDEDSESSFCDYRQGQDDDFDWQLIRTYNWPHPTPDLLRGKTSICYLLPWQTCGRKRHERRETPWMSHRSGLSSIFIFCFNVNMKDFVFGSGFSGKCHCRLLTTDHSA